MNINQQAMAVGPGTERDYVSLGRRLIAALIDNSVWLITYLWFFAGLFSEVADESPEAGGVLVIAYLSLWFNYFSFAEWRWGQTIGKNATGIMVTSLDGGGLSFGQASMRNLLRLVDWLVIGWVLIATGERHQRLGDKVAKTVVVRRPPRTGATMTRSADLTARQIARGAGEADDPPPPTGPDPAPPAGADPASPAPAPGAITGSPGGDAEDGERPGIRGRLPEITWSLKDTIWGLVAGLLLALLSPVVVLPFDPDLDTDAGLLVAQGIFGICLLAVPLGIAAGWKPSQLGAAGVRLGLRRFAFSALGWTLLALFLYYVFAGLFSALVLEPEQEDISQDLGTCDTSTLVVIAAVFLIAVLAPAAEELFFRGFIFSGLRSRMSLWPAALISGLVFGLVHAPTGITTVVPLAVLGVVLAWLYDRTGSLWPPIIAHMINNAIALAVIGC